MSRRLYQLIIVLSSLSATTFVAEAAPRKSAAADAPRQSGIVIVDAGHGGHDRGGVPGQRVSEKAMTLDVALRLRKILQASGYRVIMTRDADYFVPLGNRIALANQYRDSIFVCVHFNSARRSGANGIETYFYGSNSHTLASAVHYYVSRTAPTSNRGVRRRGYLVLRRARVPAVLVECGFLTNPTEARYVQSADYRQKLAEAIAAGVRGRGNVMRSTLGSRVAGIPLQPFLDQTRYRDPDLRRKRKKKKSKRKKSSSAEHRQIIGYYVAADRTIVPITSEA